ncbi:hypothetical protein TUN205_08444, partial [Pyrenophora tritici-repentis]
RTQLEYWEYQAGGALGQRRAYTAGVLGVPSWGSAGTEESVHSRSTGSTKLGERWDRGERTQLEYWEY